MHVPPKCWATLRFFFGLLTAAAILSGCVDLELSAMREKIAASWGHPRAYAGPKEVTIKLMRAHDDKLYFPVRINGRLMEVAIDTGSRSVFDLRALQRIGVKSYDTSEDYYGFGGYLPVRAGFIDEIDLGGLKVLGLPVVMINLSGLRHSQRVGRLPRISGLVGTDLLSALSARIDYQHLTLTLKRPAMSRHGPQPASKVLGRTPPPTATHLP